MAGAHDDLCDERAASRWGADALRQLFLFTPHGRELSERRGDSTRPAQLALALAAACDITVVTRTRLTRTLAARGRVRLRMAGAWPTFVSVDRDDGRRYVEHPLPAGVLERRLASRLLASATSGDVVMVADPRSAHVLTALDGPMRLFDAYDAWDLSPLFHGRRKRAMLNGYSTAARAADLVIANTTFMRDRMKALGARRILVLPNGAPSIADKRHRAQDVVYLGNLQSRVRTDLLLAAADAAAAHRRRLVIAGQIQERPHGWDAVITHPAIVVAGPRYGDDRSALLAEAAVGIVPHRVDDYALSQDAMKVWDYLAWGIPVVSTPVPPANAMVDLVTLAADPDRFAAGVEHAFLDHSADDERVRKQAAAANAWPVRARTLLAAIGELEHDLETERHGR